MSTKNDHRSELFCLSPTEMVDRIEQAEGLLERFVDLYGEVRLQGSMIEPGLKLWREYHEWSGYHMILTDEGWEPGEAKASYEEMAKADGVPISDFIQCEVNAPA